MTITDTEVITEYSKHLVVAKQPFQIICISSMKGNYPNDRWTYRHFKGLFIFRDCFEVVLMIKGKTKKFSPIHTQILKKFLPNS